MRTSDRGQGRIRWHCRRGMLELDLVLNAFVDRHLAGLEPVAVQAFTTLLERTDPELLELVMGREEPTSSSERDVLVLMRQAACDHRHGIQPG